MKLNKNQEDLTKNLSVDELLQVKDYQKIHSRIRVLKAQMDEIKEETHDLIEILDKMRKKENKNKK